jgi:hypothetical protein
MGIDLREEMDLMLRDYGHNIILQRTSRKIRCSCWSERAQEADSKCANCLGSGWVSRAEIRRIRRDNASQVVTLPGATTQADAGRIWTPANTIYFRHDAHPQTGDLIFEVGWRGKKPINLHGVHLINHAEPNRGDRGRIEYYAVASRLVTLDKAFRQQTLPAWFNRTIIPVPNFLLPGGEAP